MTMRGPETTPEPESEPETTPEPESEPVTTPESESEEEHNGEPEPVNIMTHMMYLASQGIHMSHKIYICDPGVGGTEVNPEPEVTPETTPEAETTSEPETTPEAESKSDTVGTGHPMDCTDMVIGAARGSKSRIFDYFSRDRSTPKRDSFFGGANSLTAALGKEENGVTTILFRRNLTGSDMKLDYDILDDDMLVIWAMGQQHFNYNHSPATGIEHCEVSEIFFYRKDVPMYHGHTGQRGAANINFQASGAQKSGSLSNGERMLTWTVGKDLVQFTFTATLAEGQWAAFGVSKDQSMPQTDVLFVGISNGVAFFSDRWSPGYSRPEVDDDTEVDYFELTYANGVATLVIDRPKDTTSEKDLSLSNCKHLILVNGGGFTGTAFNRHSTTPYVSKDPICFFDSFSNGDSEVSWTVGVSSVEFSFSTMLAEGEWSAFGLSNGKSMFNTDVYHIGVAGGNAVFTDRWSVGFSLPVVDGTDSPVSLTYENGVATLLLNRPKESNSDDDISLTDCRHIMIASGSGYTMSGTFSKHTGTPAVRPSKLCFNSLVHDERFTLLWAPTATTVEFIFKTPLSNGEWAAFGFSKNQIMAATDVMHVGVDEGVPYFSDRFASGYSRPSKDSDNGVEFTKATQDIVDGLMTLTVSRPKTANSDEDISLEACVYIIFASGSNFKASDGSFRRHTSTFVSNNQICFNH